MELKQQHSQPALVSMVLLMIWLVISPVVACPTYGRDCKSCIRNELKFSCPPCAPILRCMARCLWGGNSRGVKSVPEHRRSGPTEKSLQATKPQMLSTKPLHLITSSFSTNLFLHLRNDVVPAPHKPSSSYTVFASETASSISCNATIRRLTFLLASLTVGLNPGTESSFSSRPISASFILSFSRSLLRIASTVSCRWIKRWRVRIAWARYADWILVAELDWDRNWAVLGENWMGISVELGLGGGVERSLWKVYVTVVEEE
ncbi:hypothetical protein CFP56_041710 [Quercus suber]|uniref:Uncharacterized protein n=1 Tax=Quercus suber TaxID=58331 RepID=A0AAW0LK74_QUESU